MAAETHQNPVYDGELDDKKPGYETAVEGGYANYGPHTPGKEELEGANHPPTVPTGKLGAIGLLFWEGGSKYDAFLVAASAQVGQVMLTLPHSFAEVGLIPGIVLQLTCAGVSIYTLYLLSVLYIDFKNRLIKAGRWYDADASGNRSSITSYHEVIGAMTNRWLAVFAIIVIVITAIGTCLPQIISASSNLYLVNPSLEKRSWELIFGGMTCLTLFIPNFRNMRLFTLFALFATVFTAFYMIITSAYHLHDEGVTGHGWTRKPIGDLQSWFTGFTTILFTFGGHYMLIEVLDSMYRPGLFHRHYAGAYPCVLFLTLPTAIMVDWAYPDEIAEQGNAYYVFAKTKVRDASIGLLVAHTFVAYLLFIMPLYIMWEKACHVHHRHFFIRVVARIPVQAFIFFLAVCFPYYNIINGILGAFTTTFETFCIPTLAFNWAYWKKENRDLCPKQPLRSAFGKHAWNVTFAINWVIFVVILVFGGGFGIWAAIKGIIDSAIDWGVFPACYNCT